MKFIKKKKKRKKRKESTAVRDERDSREKFGAASKHPPLRAPFMVKLRTNDRVSMRGFFGGEKSTHTHTHIHACTRAGNGSAEKRLPFPESDRAYLVKTNWRHREGESEEKERKREKLEGREMENGTQTHCPRDEWNSEIRSAFSKMRSKYRVSGCALPLPPLFFSLVSESSSPSPRARSNVAESHFCSFHGNNAECP